MEWKRFFFFQWGFNLIREAVQCGMYKSSSEKLFYVRTKFWLVVFKTKWLKFINIIICGHVMVMLQ